MEFDNKVIAIFSQFFKGSIETLYWCIHFFRLLQFFGHNGIVIFVIKDYNFPVLIGSADHNFPSFC